MATHELYVGGPARGDGSYGRHQFPSVTFDANSAKFKGLEVSAHKMPAFFNLTRILDFGIVGSLAESNSYGLADYMRTHTVAQGDALGIIIVPENHLLLGVAYNVLRPMASGSVTLSIRGDSTNTFAAINTANVGGGFLVPTGSAAVTSGAVDLSKAVYKNVPYILDLTLTDIDPGPLSDLKIEISPLVAKLHSGGM